jgi:sarcosine oxidase
VEQVEVAVVGAGLLGSASARALAARGVPVVLFEQFALGHTRGSSHGATRIFRYSYPDPGYVEMAVRASEAWARLTADAGEELLVRTGGLDTGPGAEDCARALAECGVAHTWLTEGEVGARFGGIGTRPGERMLFQPDSGVSLAGRTVAALQRLARRYGAEIRAGTPVLGLEAGHDRVLLRTPTGEVSARMAVITTGPWAQGVLAAALPHTLRLTATVQQVRYFAPRDPAAAWPTLIEWPPEGLCWYAVPAAGVAPGIKVAAHIPGAAVDPRDGPFTEIDPALEEDAARYVRDRLPGLDPAGLAAETCLYTMTPDEDFLLDTAGPLVIGGGCSGHAFKFGPLLGEFLADLVLGQDIPVPRERFALQRPSLVNTSAPDDRAARLHCRG